MKGFIEAAMIMLIVLAGGCSVLIAVFEIIPMLIGGSTEEWDEWLSVLVLFNVAGFVIALIAGLILRRSLRS